MGLQHIFNKFYNLKGSVKIDPLILPYNNTCICHHPESNFYTESGFSLYWSLSLPNERKKKPLKTIIAARVEATAVLSSGRLNMNAITNTIPAATRAKGIQYFMASEDRPSFLTVLQLYSWYRSYLIYYTTVSKASCQYDIERGFLMGTSLIVIKPWLLISLQSYDCTLLYNK